MAVGVKVWFLNQHHATTGEEPLYEPVDRHVQPPAIAARALDALVAGPTAAEQADGLRLITSGATGYQKLHIDNGIASVTLSGGCSSGGIHHDHRRRDHADPPAVRVRQPRQDLGPGRGYGNSHGDGRLHPVLPRDVTPEWRGGEPGRRGFRSAEPGPAAPGRPDRG